MTSVRRGIIPILGDRGPPKGTVHRIVPAILVTALALLGALRAPALIHDQVREEPPPPASVTVPPDPDQAAELLRGMDGLSLPQARALKDAFSRGGPWMPAVVTAVERGGPAARHSAEILFQALERRPVRRELPPPGAADIRIVDPFGNGRRGEGIGFVFPYTWPGAVPLGVFLDRVNEASRPALPFVLDPAQHGAVLEEAPMEGAGALVMERTLAPFGLGVTYLETVALVETGGGAVFGQTVSQRKGDALLLESIISALGGSGAPPDAEGLKRAAYKALAFLDIPGLFTGYYRILKGGEPFPALDLLLNGPLYQRLFVTVADGRDREGAAALFRAYGLLPEKDPGRDRLARFLCGLPGDLKASGLALAGLESEPWALRFREGAAAHEVLAMLDRPEPALQRFAFETAAPLAPGDAVLMRGLMDRLLTWPPSDARTTLALERCLLKGIAGGLDDEEIAQLIENEGTRSAGILAAGALGGEACLETLLELLKQGGGDPADAVACAARLIRRCAPRTDAAAILKGGDAPGVPPAGRLRLAGLAAALLSREQDASGETEGRIAEILFGAMDEGGAPARTAAALFAHYPSARVLNRLPRIRSVLAGKDDQLALVLERAVLLAVGGSTLDAERIRLALEGAEAAASTRRLAASLKCISEMTSLDSFLVSVDI